MKKENLKKQFLNINLTTIKNVLKSKEVRKAAKDAIKSLKSVTDSFDINK